MSKNDLIIFLMDGFVKYFSLTYVEKYDRIPIWDPFRIPAQAVLPVISMRKPQIAFTSRRPERPRPAESDIVGGILCTGRQISERTEQRQRQRAKNPENLLLSALQNGYNIRRKQMKKKRRRTSPKPPVNRCHKDCLFCLCPTLFRKTDGKYPLQWNAVSGC